MHPFSKYLPEANRADLQQAVDPVSIENVPAVGIDEVFIVIGHLGHELAQTLGDGSRSG